MSQRSFGELKPRRRSPWPGQQLIGNMPKGVAKERATCELCEYKVKPGQRVALYFDAEAWVHLGCMMRELHRRNAEELKEMGWST